jgi:hypothetical protein
MKYNIPIKKDIYSSNKFREVVNTNFSELFSARENISVEDFFDLYNELFLEIPITGELSHTALIRKSQQLIAPGKDAKDKEIENLQALITDLQKQLLEANTPDTNTIKEHPLFPNGSLISRLTNENWPDLFYIDQGYKRPVTFDTGDSELLGSFYSLLNYGTGENDRKVPKFPNKVIDDIPSGPELNFNNINDKWSPSEFLAESEEIRITLDPEDANLNIDKYDGDYDRYRSELEKDFADKTNYISALQDKINDIKSKIQQITAG